MTQPGMRATFPASASIACLLVCAGVAGCGGGASQASPPPGAEGGAWSSGGSSGGRANDAAGDDGGAADAGTFCCLNPGDAASPSNSDSAIADAPSGGDAGALPGWTLTWSDEFNGADGTAVDPGKWIHDVGGTGWGNQELEYYTDGTQNAVQMGGNLVITATTAGASAHSCWNGTCKYTSARLLTNGKFSQKYGRFEARIQIPAGQGLWPAFWLLGTDIADVNWPACGEVDIMENIGKEPTKVHGSLHMPGGGPTGTYTLAGGGNFSDAFHTFAAEWDMTEIRFYVDDQLYETQTKAGQAAGATWEFDQPFFILLNVAVGGSWPGSPDSTTTFPQTMKVDWVRVYEPSNADP